MPFDMPATGTWEQRGGWVVLALMGDAALTIEQAAGLVGNLGFESAKFTAYHEGGVPADKGGVGWAQWTGSRRVAFENWCASQHLAPASDAANYSFLLYELDGTHRSFSTKLRQCGTIEAACLLTHRLYEIPSDVLDGSYRSQPARLALAKRALAGAMASAAPPAEPPLPTPQPQLVTDAIDVLTRLTAATQPLSTEDLIMTLRLVQRIIDAICGNAAAKAEPDKPVDVGALLDELAAKYPKLNVRSSIVDLMVALGFPHPTLENRRELADDLGVTGDVGTAEVNAAMHKALLRRVAENGGKVPPELM